MAAEGGETNVVTAVALLSSQVANLSANIVRMEGRLEKAAIDTEMREQKKLDAIVRQMEEMNRCIGQLEVGAASRAEQIKIVLEEVDRLRASELWWKVGLAVAIIIGTILGIYK